MIGSKLVKLNKFKAHGAAQRDHLQSHIGLNMEKQFKATGARTNSKPSELNMEPGIFLTPNAKVHMLEDWCVCWWNQCLAVLVNHLRTKSSLLGVLVAQIRLESSSLVILVQVRKDMLV